MKSFSPPFEIGSTTSHQSNRLWTGENSFSPPFEIVVRYPPDVGITFYVCFSPPFEIVNMMSVKDIKNGVGMFQSSI